MVLWYELRRQGTTLPMQVSALLAADPQWPSNHCEPDEVMVMPTRDEQSTLGGFADDIHVTADNPAALTRAHLLTVTWTVACDMKVNVKKCSVCGPARLHIGEKPISAARSLVLLGNKLHFKGHVAGADSAQIQETKRGMERVGHIPGPPV
jgi:hypothetical protein